MFDLEWVSFLEADSFISFLLCLGTREILLGERINECRWIYRIGGGGERKSVIIMNQIAFLSISITREGPSI